MEMTVRWTEICVNIRTRMGDDRLIFERDGYRSYKAMAKYAKKECSKMEAILLDIVAVRQFTGKLENVNLGLITETKCIELSDANIKEDKVDG